METALSGYPMFEDCIELDGDVNRRVIIGSLADDYAIRHDLRDPLSFLAGSTCCVVVARSGAKHPPFDRPALRVAVRALIKRRAADIAQLDDLALRRR